MDIIELTRELGRAIQADPRFVEMQLARQQSDEDQELQDAIGEFNLKRMAISNEAAKPDRNDETMQRLNKEFREVYARIMANEHMKRYDAAKTEFDAMFQRVKGTTRTPATMTRQAVTATAQAAGVAATDGWVLREKGRIRGRGHGGFFAHDEAVF